jgi:catechol 2,3-dioxygenase-like lactoylglutathione lyase family enzyme
MNVRMAAANPPLSPESAVIRPARLAHVVFRTNQLEPMVRWYCRVLGAHVVHADAKIAFVTYDEEHHRLAFIAAGPYRERPQETSVGFYHVAFTYPALGQLLSSYRRLKAEGIVPWRCIHHGPTVSMYFRDPDGNDVELQVDAFPNLEAAAAYMRGPDFSRDPVGIGFDPEQMIGRYESGVSLAELLRRPDAL